MTNLKAFSKRLAMNNRGQGMVEYILLLVVIVAIVMAMKGKLKSYITEDLWGKLQGGMNNIANDQ